MNFSIYSTNFGPGAFIYDNKGLRRVFMPEESIGKLIKKIKKAYKKPEEESLEHIYGVKCMLENYFRGKKVDFSGIKLYMNGISTFTQSVLAVLKKIPYGELKTYKWVARQLGNDSKARAVGRALHSNPFPVILPCHRIIKSGGELGGFASGMKWKVRLLNIEKILK